MIMMAVKNQECPFPLTLSLTKVGKTVLFQQ